MTGTNTTATTTDLVRSAAEVAREHAEADARLGRTGDDACGCGACRKMARIETLKAHNRVLREALNEMTLED